MDIEKKQRLKLTVDMEDAVYFVCEGRIKVSYFSECGKEFIFKILEPGDIYTFHSEASASALTHSRVCIISMNNFKNLLMEYPFLNFRMYKLLGNTLKSYNDLVLNLTFKEVSSRLAEYLMEHTQSSEWFTSGLTHEELACLLGSTRQTISTTLNRWERQGILEMSHGSLRVFDRERLQNML
jgi:CRP-like cAMP-binding protein